MNRTKTEAVVARLQANAAEMKFGTVSVAFKVHDGRVVEVSYTNTEKTIEREPKTDQKQ